MPDRRHHRGPHPEDARLFAPTATRDLRAATEDLCWLLDRGYATRSSLKLVGDRYSLTQRQRIAVSRCACSQDEIQHRQQKQLQAEELAGRELWIDGYNVLTSLEAALAGGVILAARDSCYRDMASMHGNYRKVAETEPALQLLGRSLAALHLASCHWLLDRPVSNSGRLRRLMLDLAAQSAWPWQVELVVHTDRTLADCPHPIATSDRAILDRCQAWWNLVRWTIDRDLPGTTIHHL